MVFVIVGVLLIVALAPYTYYSVKRATLRSDRTLTRSIYLFPIVQVSGGLIAIAVGTAQLVR